MSYIKQAELVDFHPLGKCRGFGCYASNFFVVLKYRIDCLQVMHFIALHRFILFLIELSKLIELIVFLLGVNSFLCIDQQCSH